MLTAVKTFFFCHGRFAVPGEHLGNVHSPCFIYFTFVLSHVSRLYAHVRPRKISHNKPDLPSQLQEDHETTPGLHAAHVSPTQWYLLSIMTFLPSALSIVSPVCYAYHTSCVHCITLWTYGIYIFGVLDLQLLPVFIFCFHCRSFIPFTHFILFIFLPLPYAFQVYWLIYFVPL